MSENERHYRTLYGSMVAKSKIIGYCRYHKVHLTEGQIKEKKCIGKGCKALKKWDCAYWDERRRIKEVKQMKKEQGIPSWQKVKIRVNSKGELLTKLRKEK